MANPSTITHTLLWRAHENYFEAWRRMARAAVNGAIEEGDGLLCTSEGMPLAFLNQALITRPVADPAALIARADRFYAARRFPWLLRAAEPVSLELERAAVAAGLVRSASLPGMVLAPLAGEARATPGLEIRVVDDLASLRVFNEVSDAGFGLPPEVTGALTTPPLLETPDLTMYIGYVDGRPATTSMRVTSHGIAGVYTVATLPEFRGRGLGEAMTWRAALDGLVEGCVAASLQASDMGFPIYARMGFRHVVDYATWDSSAGS